MAVPGSRDSSNPYSVSTILVFEEHSLRTSLEKEQKRLAWYHMSLLWRYKMVSMTVKRRKTNKYLQVNCHSRASLGTEQPSKHMEELKVPLKSEVSAKKTLTRGQLYK